MDDSRGDDLLKDLAQRVGISDLVRRLESVERKIGNIDDRLLRVEANQMSAADIERVVHNAVRTAPKVQMDPPTLEQLLPVLRTASAIIDQEEQEAADAARGRWLRETARSPRRLMGVTVGLLGLAGITNLSQALDLIQRIAAAIAS